MRNQDLAEGARRAVVVNGWPVLVLRSAGTVYAVIDRCTHAASSMGSGKLRNGFIMCAVHGARFDVKTGRCIGNVYSPLKTFPVQITDDWIDIEVPGEAPGEDVAPMPAHHGQDKDRATASVQPLPLSLCGPDSKS
jgi:nitrite reductase/ring-hydroxylating ferredoxin subunit